MMCPFDGAPMKVLTAVNGSKFSVCISGKDACPEGGMWWEKGKAGTTWTDLQAKQSQVGQKRPRQQEEDANPPSSSSSTWDTEDKENVSGLLRQAKARDADQQQKAPQPEDSGPSNEDIVYKIDHVKLELRKMITSFNDMAKIWREMIDANSTLAEDVRAVRALLETKDQASQEMEPPYTQNDGGE